MSRFLSSKQNRNDQKAFGRYGRHITNQANLNCSQKHFRKYEYRKHYKNESGPSNNRGNTDIIKNKTHNFIQSVKKANKLIFVNKIKIDRTKNILETAEMETQAKGDTCVAP